MNWLLSHFLCIFTITTLLSDTGNLISKRKNEELKKNGFAFAQKEKEIPIILNNNPDTILLLFIEENIESYKS